MRDTLNDVTGLFSPSLDIIRGDETRARYDSARLTGIEACQRLMD